MPGSRMAPPRHYRWRSYSDRYRLMPARSHRLRVTGSATRSHRTTMGSRVRPPVSSTAFRDRRSPASILRPDALTAMLFASADAGSEVTPWSQEAAECHGRRASRIAVCPTTRTKRCRCRMVARPVPHAQSAEMPRRRRTIALMRAGERRERERNGRHAVVVCGRRTTRHAI